MKLSNLLKSLKTYFEKPFQSIGILHLWEDDYLMVELLPQENLDFVKAETKRINNFGEAHFDGNGFTEITAISESPLKTIERLIEISEVDKIFIEAGLKKVYKFYMQGVGVIEGEKAPLGFGTNKFAILCDKEGSLLKNIFITGHCHNEEEFEILNRALLAFGRQFNFIAVNWYQGEYYNLVEEQSVEEFTKNIC